MNRNMYINGDYCDILYLNQTIFAIDKKFDEYLAVDFSGRKPTVVDDDFLFNNGFIYHDLFGMYVKNTICNVFKNPNPMIFAIHRYNDDSFCIKLPYGKSQVLFKYTYQLEKLYFALTGNQL